jgi:DNA-binding GntR family transcriptional regulator
MSSLEFEPPKYAKVVAEIRRRIEDGTYPPGSALPSETQLVREFAMGRTTVVRALQILQRDGWIDREHGRGSFVKGRPAREEGGSRPGLAVLDQAENQPEIRLVQVGSVAAPRQVAALLGVAEGAMMARRQWVGTLEGVPGELVSCWFPPALAWGTDLGKPEPLGVGVRAHLHAVKKLRVDHIAERLSARLPFPEESGLLKIKASAPVLSILASAHQADDAVLFAVEVVMPGELHELEDVYSVTT